LLAIYSGNSGRGEAPAVTMMRSIRAVGERVADHLMELSLSVVSRSTVLMMALEICPSRLSLPSPNVNTNSCACLASILSVCRAASDKGAVDTRVRVARGIDLDGFFDVSGQQINGVDDGIVDLPLQCVFAQSKLKHKLLRLFLVDIEVLHSRTDNRFYASRDGT